MKKLLIPALVLLFVAAVFLVRLARPGANLATEQPSAQSPVPQASEPPFKQPVSVPPSVAGEALHDSTLLGMIRNAKVAELKGDRTTREAMVAGLKKEPASAKRLLAQEILRSNDSNDTSALNRILAEIP